ncbi:MAG: heparinase II/III family protein [Candidatus Kapabacteria bacterium]|nr:heparinase II/III family protein [Candidatus Kapabacteria bacterium]
MNDYLKSNDNVIQDTHKIKLNLNHKFNLLGSDNLNCNYENISNIKELIKFLENNEAINSANIDNSIKILKLIDTEYQPINWQCDFKSNYCWKANQISNDIVYGNVENVDIKVPWELARFNDFTYLSLFHLVTKEEAQKKEIEFEFRNRILDFIAMNPPNFGVNWINAMEVGIRAANWLVSYDILRLSGAKFDDDFKKVFLSSIYSHYKFIIENLEWSSGMRGNHYFANIVSLIIITAYLPNYEETIEVLQFSINELIQEVFYQFNEDGSNFEASTYYHCFVVELLLYALFFIQKLPKDKVIALSEVKTNRIKLGSISKSIIPVKFKNNNEKIDFDKEFWFRLIKILEFTDNILLEDGATINIGDMDSGRFLKFSSENYLWLRDFINKIFYNNINNNELDDNLENYIFSDLINKLKFELNSLNIDLKGFSKSLYLYKDFGLYLIKNENFQIYFRCGSIGQKGKGGHAHNDQLSIIVLVNNYPVFIDSGTYVYTGNHKLRNKFRSTEMHNTLSIKGFEQNQWNEGKKDDLFWLNDTSKAKISKISEYELEGVHFGFGKPTIRRIKINDNTIIGEDLNELSIEKKVIFHLNPLITNIQRIKDNTIEVSYDRFILQIFSDDGDIIIEESDCSPEYGKLIKNQKVIINSLKQKIQWTITVIKQ